MATTPQELWEEILSVLKHESEDLSDESFDLWLRPTTAVSYIDNTLTINIPNKFFKHWIEQREKLIIAIAQRFTASTVNIDYAFSSASQEETQTTKLQMKKPWTPPIPDIASEKSFLKTNFNPKYTFDSFVVGGSNRFANAACEAVAKDPGKSYNPLFIYGGVGLGKTHLMHAVGHYIKIANPKSRILYITSEKFINEFINSIRYDKPLDFRNKYRSLEVLLIDDIQFFGGKESSQEEFFHTFNTLYDSHKQIVVSSDRPPKELPSLEERLISRFEWGLVTDIQPPDLETRIAILQKKAEMEQLHVPDDVHIFIAERIKSNIRELEGALIRIVAFSSLTGASISVDLAEQILRDIIPKGAVDGQITLEIIQQIVAKNFNLDLKDMKSKKRTNAIAFPRQIAMYIARDLTDYSFPEIGRSFGGKDHATVIHGYEKIKLKANKDPFFSQLINKIIKEIKESV